MAEERRNEAETEEVTVSVPEQAGMAAEEAAEEAGERDGKWSETAYDEMEDRFFLEFFGANRVIASSERLDIVYLRFIENGERHSESERGVYIAELAKTMGLPITRVSSVMSRLQDRGYIIWKPNQEKDRTYVELTGKAREVLAQDMDRNWKNYKAIRENIAREDLATTVLTMHKISELFAEES